MGLTHPGAGGLEQEGRSLGPQARWYRGRGSSRPCSRACRSTKQAARRYRWPAIRSRFPTGCTTRSGAQAPDRRGRHLYAGADRRRRRAAKLVASVRARSRGYRVDQSHVQRLRGVAPVSTSMIDRVEHELAPFAPAPLERTSGNFWLIETLRRWGITAYAGVNGGGLIHVTKHLEPLSDPSEATDGAPRLLTMGEYVAGFVPLGYYLASRRVGGR